MYSSICAAEAKWKLVLDTRLTFSFEHTVWPFFSVVGVISIVQTHYSYSTWLTLVISHTHALFISCVPLTHICRIQSVERCHACDGACIFFFFSHHLEMWIYLSGKKKKKKKKKKKTPAALKRLNWTDPLTESVTSQEIEAELLAGTPGELWSDFIIESC